MIITDRPSRVLGAKLHFPISSFNIDSIYFSDESLKTDAIYAERIKITKHKNGLRIKAISPEERCCIDVFYSELSYIKLFGPDECAMPKSDSEGISSLLFGWAHGLASLSDTKLKIGGRAELYYKSADGQHVIILYHSKQDIFDMFKYLRKRLKEFII